MLTRLKVRNYAIVDEVEVELGRGLTVLTGETGAGKSILVDALGLVLGERGGAGLVRPQAPRAEIEAEFDVTGNPAAEAWLAEQALDADGECLLRRVIGEDGRSRAFVNGNAVTLQNLKTLGERLLDIHGQHFHQSLVRPEVQRDLLDHFGGLAEVRQATADAFGEWQARAARLAELETAEAERDARLDLLAFQAGELDALALESGEYDALLAERRKLGMSGRLLEGLGTALAAAADGETASAQQLLAEAERAVASLVQIDDALEPARRMLEEAGIQVSEAAGLLHRYADSLELDAERREEVEARVDAIQTVARKHRVEPGELIALHARLAAERAALEDAEATGARLRQETAAAQAVYREHAERLSAGRRKAAASFAGQVTEAMQGLGMPGGVFEASVEPRPEADARAHGLDRIEYRISANPGQPPMPLAKVASGGELSRMSLAIQVIASDGSAIPTMVFDEVDSGVGGGVAEMVGRRLKELAASRQVLCVTHLPQLASLADRHFRVSKATDGKSTRTAVASLSAGERVEELARMLGGLKITRKTRAHAEEMLKSGAA